MTEYSRFFNSVDGDNLYQASDFAEYFSTFLSDGIFSYDGNLGLKVNKSDGLKINVATGFAFIRGYMYKNDNPLTFTLATADNTLDRIDRVVLRFDELEREITVIVKTGISGSSPVPSTLENTDTAKELSLAQIKINKNTITLVDSDITDERYSDNCGVVSSLITIPVQDMWDQWNAWFQNRQNEIGVRLVNGPTEPPGLLAGDIWLREI